MNLLQGLEVAGTGKSCLGASSCQPKCCKPTIKKPCKVTTHTYQRQRSEKKPPSCCKPAGCCAPVKKCCAPVNKCCAPVKKSCAPAKKCCAPVKKCCAPAKKCCAPAKSCCDSGKNDCCGSNCCKGDPCRIAELIFKSQTACYAKDRRRAIDDLGDFDCSCNPEIMVAFVFALNDAVETVRAEAADELGDQFRKNSCCCSNEITEALKAALGDCDRKVRREAQQALEACGYEVVDGCCTTCCSESTVPTPTTTPTPSTTPTPVPTEAKPAPAPPEDPEAYLPSNFRLGQTLRRPKGSTSLADLFGLARKS